VILLLVVHLKKFIVMIMMLVLRMGVILNQDAHTLTLNVLIIMNVLKIDVINQLDVFLLLSVAMMMTIVPSTLAIRILAV
jgi:hypothetical protein